MIRPGLIMALTAFAIIFNCLTINPGAEGFSGKRVFDDAALLSHDEIATLEAEIAEKEKASALLISIVTTDNFGDNKSDSAVVKYAEDYYAKHFGYNSDGILFLINNDPANRYDYIVTAGRGRDVFSNADCDTILDDTYSYLVDGDYISAAFVFISWVDYFTTVSSVDDYPKSNDNYTGNYGRDFEAIKSSFSVGFIVSAIVVILIIIYVNKTYKIRPISDSRRYLNRSTVHYNQMSDVFLRQYVTKVKVKTNNGSGGRSSGGSGRGGSFGGSGRRR